MAKATWKLPDGETSATVTISTADDLLDEADGAVTLTILPPLPPAEETSEDINTDYEPALDSDPIWSASATVVVIDDDERGFSMADAEADEADGDIEFTVTTLESALELSVDWATAAGGGENAATADDDYEAASGTLTFAPGETSQTISVTLLDDDLHEADETFKIVLSNPSGAQLNVMEVTGTIKNDDLKQQLSIHRVTVSSHSPEGVDHIFVMRRCNYYGPDDCRQEEDKPRGRLEVCAVLMSAGDFYGDAVTSAQECEPRETEDFEAGSRGTRVGVPGALEHFTEEDHRNDNSRGRFDMFLRRIPFVFEAGSWETSSLTIPTIDDEEFVLPFGEGWIIIQFRQFPGDPESRAQGDAITYDNDAPIIVSDVVADEDAGVMVFTVTTPYSSTIRPHVDIFTVDGTATSRSSPSSRNGNLGKDFTWKTLGMNFETGETEKQFRVSLVDDGLDEEDLETFTVLLANPVNGRLKDAIGVGTIRDNDEPLTVSLVGPTSAQVAENTTLPPLFEVRAHSDSTTVSERDISVHWSVSPGTATPDEDYQETGGVIVIPAGHTSAFRYVRLLDDDLFEEEFETFTVELTGVENAVLNEDAMSYQFSIEDDERLSARVRSDADAWSKGRTPPSRRCSREACPRSR